LAWPSGTSLLSMINLICCKGQKWDVSAGGDPSPPPAPLLPFPRGLFWLLSRPGPLPPHQAPQPGQGDQACLGDGGHVGVDIVQGVVDVGEGASHSLGEAGVADEGADITSPAREGRQGQHTGRSVPMLPTRTLRIHPHRPQAAVPPLPEHPSECPAHSQGTREAGHGKLRHGGTQCLARLQSCQEGSAPCQRAAPRGQLPTATASSPLSRRAGICSCEQWQLPGMAAKRRRFHPPSGPSRSLPASALTGGEQRPAGRRPRAPGAGSPSAGPASGTCGPRSSRSSGSSRSSIPPVARG